MCYRTHKGVYALTATPSKSPMEKQVAGKDNAGPSIGGTSTACVSQNYLCIQNSILKSCTVIYLYYNIMEIVQNNTTFH